MDNDHAPHPRTLALWSAPRARSTAFFRAMLERGDLVGLHEPFCNVTDFGATTVDGREVRSHRELIGAVRALSAHRTVFLKDTTDHRFPAVLEDSEFLREATHTFLIRRPEQIAASFYALKPDMEAGALGLEQLHELHTAVVAAGGRAVVVDSDDLVRDPERTLAAYCREVGLPFDPAALRWAPGDRPEWERSKRWHVDVSESSGFRDSVTEYADTVDNNPRLASFSARHQPYYQALRRHKLALT
ncbi:sulfotransferase family protein [Nocardiopsis sp. FIRDI 009]|uniref:sulfotransferase-like domain-containing protein n=1 Tax=Nocardiopsis sp. FIRDI 009 TaxID=714197 RepID=UPI000E25A3F9|nr:sulfotransferase family protein [Nocardiopsis sp. FIRDI 009]